MASILAGCAGGDGPGVHRSAIIGGQRDTADPAAVMVVIQKLPDSERDCSGVVVAPHVVLTAAHCIDPRVVGDGYTHYVYIGADIDDSVESADRGNWFDVISKDFDPEYDPKVLDGAHDVGVLVTKQELPMVPLPLLRRALTIADVGKGVRVLGYGRTVAKNPNSLGARYQKASVITATNDGELVRDADTCEADSGGPTLIMENGSEAIAGLHSWGEHAQSCTGPDHDARVDTHLTFIDTHIAAADPTYLAPTVPDLGAAPPAHHSGCSTVGTGAETGEHGVVVVMLLGAALARGRRSGWGRSR